MLLPAIFGESLFDDWMDPFDKLEKSLLNTERELYGKRGANLMKTDVRETDSGYEVDVDLPGFKKEDLTLTLENGTLTISAVKNLEKDQNDGAGRYIRRERYAGQCSRSFYVGDAVTQDEIRARFEDGILRLTVPKKDAAALPQRNLIAIEG